MASNPTAFLDTVTPLDSLSFARCPLNGLIYQGQPIPLAFNSDGTRNACSNPAHPGSVVTLFLAGLGVTAPPLATGSINPNPGIPLNLPITVNNSSAFTVASAVAAPGSIAGVWQLSLRMPQDIGALAVSLSVNGVPVRETALAIFVQ